jgi:hypothetical protein
MVKTAVCPLATRGYPGARPPAATSTRAAFLAGACPGPGSLPRANRRPTGTLAREPWGSRPWRSYRRRPSRAINSR